MNVKPRSQDVDVYVGARVRELRRGAGMTLKQLASALGVTMQQCAKYERGINRMTGARLHKVAKVLGVEPADLFPPLDNSVHAEVMAMAATLSEESLQRLNAEVLQLLAEERDQCGSAA